MFIPTTVTTVLIDAEAFGGVLRYADVVLREPEFIDPLNSTAVWIGTGASVEVPVDQVTPALAWLARSAYAYRDRRPAPETFGIKVTTHDPDYINPAFAGRPDARALTLWAEFQDATVEHDAA